MNPSFNLQLNPFKPNGRKTPQTGLEGNFSNDFECLWDKISTNNSVFHIAVVYHPPEPQYNADNLIDFLANTCNDILVSDPNSKLIICGDLNQLRYKDLLLQNSLFQMVRSPTRQDKILDVFITNVPHLWGKIAVVKCLVRSDHLMVAASPRVPTKSLRKTTHLGHAREQNKIKMSCGLQEMDWPDYFSPKWLMIKFNWYKINSRFCLTAAFQRSLLEFLQESLLLCHCW